ncbi:LTA synthase family protein [Candidatus Nitrosacidococcus sp. I8]|uniref:LTA synthase family protein n=1 Tax=Candidatus Nitrosacidococcus sp. I8 TaxID=2942908 RepID=UPI002226ECD2|nr:sulfatase-like hydrolase/transferase [Candidatus Nitrosacidococcus sp. I8]CAH9018767.1 hypothetical protein NURINAE_01121 [Candidatus Nitrosacidococcus sp. I8]
MVAALFSLPLLFIFLSIGRALLSEQGNLASVGCHGCLILPTLQHDLILIAIFLIASILWVKLPRYLRWLALLIQIGLVFAITADLIMLAEFGMRLSWHDVIKFGGEFKAIKSYIEIKLATITGILTLIGDTILLISWIGHLRAANYLGQQGIRWLMMSVFACVLLYMLPTMTHHPLPWLYRNVVEINLPSGVDQVYSQTYQAQLKAHYKPPPWVCTQGLGLRQNVIIVLIESWSWYHSKDRLGIMDATSHLDQLAQKGTVWTQFFSNGFTTDHGLIALLGGVVPLPAVNRYHSLEGYAGFDKLSATLPQRLAADGYQSYFFTTGDLNFMDKGTWLKKLGFHHIEGDDHSFYQGMPRFAFNAAHDGWLYQRFLTWLDHEVPRKHPYLAVLETVTTHPPFMNPETGQQGEQAAFRFADTQVAHFVKELEQQGFFKDGLLILTSDQRALTPLRAAEVQAFGDAAPALLPLIILGGSFNGGEPITTTAQMADMPASLDYLLTDRSCQYQGRGNLFTIPPKSPQCILRPQGDQRDIIDAYCGTEHAQIKLDGDHTRVIKGHLPDAEKIIQRINLQRILLGIQNIDFTHIM